MKPKGKRLSDDDLSTLTSALLDAACESARAIRVMSADPEGRFQDAVARAHAKRKSYADLWRKLHGNDAADLLSLWPVELSSLTAPAEKAGGQ